MAGARIPGGGSLESGRPERRPAKGDRARKKAPAGGPRAPLKAALQPLAASGAPGAPSATPVPVRPLADEASPTPGNPRPRRLPPPTRCARRTVPRFETWNGQSRTFCLASLASEQKTPSPGTPRGRGIPAVASSDCPQSGTGSPKAGRGHGRGDPHAWPSNSHRPSSKRSGSTEREAAVAH